MVFWWARQGGWFPHCRNETPANRSCPCRLRGSGTRKPIPPELSFSMRKGYIRQYLEDCGINQLRCREGPPPMEAGLRRTNHPGLCQDEKGRRRTKQDALFSAHKRCTLASLRPLDRRRQGISNYEYRSNFMESCRKVSSQSVKHEIRF